MSLLFMDGFAHYDLATIGQKYDYVLNPSSTMAVGATYGRYGGSGLHMGTGSYLEKTLITTTSGLIVGFALRVPSSILTGGSGVFQIMADKFSSSVNLALNMRQTGSIGLVNSSGATSFTTGAESSITLSPDTWYYIEVSTAYGRPPGANKVYVKVNGNIVVDWTANTTAAWVDGGGFKSNKISIGTGGISPSLTNAFDIADLYVLSRTGPSNNTFIGDRVVQTIYPTADGSSTDFTVVGASAVAAVSDNPPDGDTSYISSIDVGDKQSFLLTDLSGTPSVNGVQFNALSRKEGVGTRVLAPFYRIGGTDYLASAWGRYPSYYYIPTPLDTNPATAADWTYSDVNALEVGVSMYS